MKIALLLKGSSIGSYEHWQFKDRTHVHYKNSIDNLRRFLIDKYDCDVFFHTWKQDAVDLDEYSELVSDFKPKAYLIEKDIDGTHGPALGKKNVLTTQKVIETFENYRKSNQVDYDLVILTRFDAYFLQEFNLQKIKELEDTENNIFIYAMNSNLGRQFIDKNTTATQGIDDSFVIFSPNTIKNYYECLALKTETIATTRSETFFKPKQHPSLHHLYYLLDDNVKIRNLAHVFDTVNKLKSLYGIIKQVQETSVIVRQCKRHSPQKLTKLKSDLFVFHYE